MENDRDFFYKVGRTATDKFYVNEDRRVEKAASLKGGSKT
jgi:hypothetical protein